MNGTKVQVTINNKITKTVDSVILNNLKYMATVKRTGKVKGSIHKNKHPLKKVKN